MPLTMKYCENFCEISFTALIYHIHNLNYLSYSSDRIPFELEVFFNDEEQDTANRGFCLNYYQLPC